MCLPEAKDDDPAAGIGEGAVGVSKGSRQLALAIAACGELALHLLRIRQ